MRRTFASLRHRNYRLFFAGQVVSQTGSWMQRIALGWFVLQLTRLARSQSASWPSRSSSRSRCSGCSPGVLTPTGSTPAALVIGTQAAQLVTAIALAWIALGGFAQPWMLYRSRSSTGSCSCSTYRRASSSRTGWSAATTCRTRSPLNSSLFNASRIFGPVSCGDRLRPRAALASASSSTRSASSPY